MVPKDSKIKWGNKVKSSDGRKTFIIQRLNEDNVINIVPMSASNITHDFESVLDMTKIRFNKNDFTYIGDSMQAKDYVVPQRLRNI